MTLRYVYSGATGTGTGADWTNAYTKLGTAATACAAGDTVYVAHDHNEVTTGAVTNNFPTGTQTKVICVNRAGSVPPVLADLRTTAIVSSSGVTGGADMVTGGSIYVYGVQFVAGLSSTNFLYLRMGGAVQTFDHCVFKMASTSTSSMIYPTFSSGGDVEWLNCQIEVAATAHGVAMQTGLPFKWVNDPTVPAFTSTSTVYPNTVMMNGGVQGCRVTVDFTGLPSGRALTNFVNTDQWFINCKIPTGVVLSSSTPSNGDGPFHIINSHSTTGFIRNERWTPGGGKLLTETTIVRTNGANDGVAPYSWNCSGSALTTGSYLSTFEGTLLNSVVGVSRTLTLHMVTNLTALTNADIWIEVDYPGSSSSPLGQRATNRVDLFSAASNHPTDTAAWTTTGIATPVKQKMQVSFTPQLAGPIRWRVKLVKPNQTVYICPKAELN